MHVFIYLFLTFPNFSQHSPKPADYRVQASRQKWFRSVTYLGDRLSRPCTKRILCEQSCLDGLESVDGSTEASHPQALPTDSLTNLDYVQAYTEGEKLACFGDRGPNFTAAHCRDSCAAKYSSCERAMEANLTLQLYYGTSRYFHRLGMWLFALNQHHLKDAYKRVAENGSVELALEHDFTKLLVAMNDLNVKFVKQREEKLSEENQGRQEKQAFEKNLSIYWPMFLNAIKMKSDLSRSLLVTADYDQFTKDLLFIRETLEETNFKQLAAVKSESNTQQPRSVSVKAIVGVLLFVSIAVGLLIVLLVCYNSEALSSSTVAHESTNTTTTTTDASKTKPSTSPAECAEVTAERTTEL